MKVSNWKAHGKNTLKGFFTIEFTNGLIVNDCMYHVKEDKSWIALPSKQFEKSDGTTGYTAVVSISEAKYAAFQSAVNILVKAVIDNPTKPDDFDDEIPF